MRWAKENPSLAAVVALCGSWMALGLASSPTLPIRHYMWENDEWSLAEHVDLAIVGLGAVAWLWIAARAGRADRRLARGLSVAMAIQLAVLFGEELDWGGQLVRLGIRERNIRMAVREIIPLDIMDSPGLAAYLVGFHIAPLIPLPALQSLLDRASPVRAERRDAWAILAGFPLSLLVLLTSGGEALGMFHQQMVYVVLVVVTVRVARRVRGLGST